MSNRFDESFIYNLKGLAANLDKIADKELMLHLNLTSSQFTVMSILDNSSKVKQNFISKKLNISEAAVSKQIKILVEKGFVTVSVNSEDKKSRVLEMTDVGESVFKEGWIVINRINKDLYKEIYSHDTRVLEGLIKKMFKTTSSTISKYREYLNKR